MENQKVKGIKITIAAILFIIIMAYVMLGGVTISFKIGSTDTGSNVGLEPEVFTAKLIKIDYRYAIYPHPLIILKMEQYYFDNGRMFDSSYLEISNPSLNARYTITNWEGFYAEAKLAD